MSVLRKKNTRKKTPLKKKISNYFFNTKEQDICCEKYYNRKLIVSEILTIYKTVYGDCINNNEYLELVDNDVAKFVGYRSSLDELKDKTGVNLLDEISSRNKNKLSKENIVSLLMELPLYYILAFLGHAHLHLKEHIFDRDKHMYSVTDPERVIT